MAVEEIDFENFQVEPSRAQSIRDLILKVKSDNWLSDIKTLITELGSEESGQTFKKGENNSPLLPGFSLDVPSKIYRYAREGHNSWTFVEQNQEMFICKDTVAALEATQLPKGQEYALLYVNEECLSELVALIEGDLKYLLKEAKGKKSARAASFKARFEASSAG